MPEKSFLTMDKKILIAEDSSVIQNLARKIFQQLNYSIASAKNGKEAVNMLSNDDFDVLLLDINIPQLDGMECARQIRQMEDSSKANIPIIAISGNAKNYTLEDFKDAGMTEYMQKPLNFDELVEMVKKYTA